MLWIQLTSLDQILIHDGIISSPDSQLLPPSSISPDSISPGLDPQTPSRFTPRSIKAPKPNKLTMLG